MWSFLQAKYAKKLVKKFGFDNGKLVCTPMSIMIKLSQNSSKKEVK